MKESEINAMIKYIKLVILIYLLAKTIDWVGGVHWGLWQWISFIIISLVIRELIFKKHAEVKGEAGNKASEHCSVNNSMDGPIATLEPELQVAQDCIERISVRKIAKQ